MVQQRDTDKINHINEVAGMRREGIKILYVLMYDYTLQVSSQE